MTRGVGGHGPANIMKHLKGIHFPADRKKIIDHAEKTRGLDTKEVVETLRQIPDKQYKSPAEITHEVGKID